MENLSSNIFDKLILINQYERENKINTAKVQIVIGGRKPIIDHAICKWVYININPKADV